jgi:sugar phosphate isomerase/epimerase
MQVGFTIKRFQGFEPPRLVRTARRFGINAVELDRSSLVEVESVAAELGTMVCGFHLPLIGQDGYDLSSVAHKDEIDRLIDTLNAQQRRLHLQYCLSHPPEPDESDTEVETSEDLLVENLSRLQIPVVLENVPSWDRESFERLYEKIRGVLGARLLGICFDAPHAFLRGDDPIACFEDWSRDVMVIHLSDCSASEDLHLPFDAGGVLPIDGFLDAVLGSAFDGFLILEIEPRSIEELRPLMDSYLKVLRRTSRGRYIAATFRLFAARMLRIAP